MSSKGLALLWHVAQELCITVRWSDLQSTCPGVYAYVQPFKRLVVLDHSLADKPRRLKCVLAEETGHVLYPPLGDQVVYHLAGAYRMLDSPGRTRLETLVAKDERLALKWATKLLIPDRLFWHFAVQGPHTWDEWLDYFDVEDWFLRAKFEFIFKDKPLEWRRVVAC